jgi:hypothetical protein
MSYDMIDRFLRNNLGDDDYAEYSAALDALASPPAAQPEPSCEDAKLAETIMSDCGHSTNNTRLLERITNRLACLRPLAAQPAKPVKLDDIEQYRMQMAGISTAAIGYWKEGDGIHPDYDTVPLRDVAKLYAKYDALFKEKNTQPASEPVAPGVERIWACKIGGLASHLPHGADAPMRQAVQDAFAQLTGQDAEFCFSGWGGELTEPERAVVENRLPSAEYEAEWLGKNTPQQAEPVECQYGNGGYACCEGGPCKADEQNNAEAQQEPTVPTFNGPASRKLADLQAHGWQVNGYHIQRQDGDTWKHGAITAGGMVLWWHGKQDAASPDKCPTCGSDCNEIDELAKAELEQQLAKFVRVGTLYSESGPIDESGWRFTLGGQQCTGFAVEWAVFIVVKGST